jgi:hypothetical protein
VVGVHGPDNVQIFIKVFKEDSLLFGMMVFIGIGPDEINALTDNLSA